SFTWLQTLLVVTGLIFSFRRAPPYGAMVIISSALAGPVFAALANLNVGILGYGWVLQRFFVLPHVLLAPLVPLGLDALEGAFVRPLLPGPRPFLDHGLTGLVLLWIVVTSALRFQTVDARGNHLARTFGEDVLATLDRNAVLLASGDEVIGPIAFLQAVEHQR